MSSPKKLRANLDAGKSVAERETAAGWGGPDTAAATVPPDQHHTRREYMSGGKYPQDSRRQLAMPGSELERIVKLVSPAQIQHAGLIQRRRGMPGKRDYPAGTPQGKVKAVITHGLGSAVARPADLGADPLSTPVGTDYLHQHGPSRDPYARYVAARGMLPPASGPHGGLPRWHELSSQRTFGDDITAAFGGQYS